MTTQLESRLSTYSPTILSLFRIVFGVLFLQHGTQKLFGWPVAATQPVPTGSWPMWWAGLIELVAGILITVGLFTRIAAFIAAGELAVAYFWQHLPKGFWPIVNGGELAVLYCFGFLLLAAVGGGAYAMDTRRRGRVTTVAPRRRFAAPRRRFGALRR